MIQRVQSIFLLAMALVMLSILFFPIWVKENPDTGEMVILNAFQVRFEDQSKLVPEVIAVKSTIYISILAILSAGVSLFSLFQYKNRLNQMKLGALNALLIGGVVLCCYLFSQKGSAFMPGDYQAEFETGFFIPVIALICNSIANRFIKRDEKLVQDSNRMR